MSRRSMTSQNEEDTCQQRFLVQEGSKDEAYVCRVSVFHTSLRNPIKLNGSIQRSTFRRAASVVLESFTLNTL